MGKDNHEYCLNQDLQDVMFVAKCESPNPFFRGAGLIFVAHDRSSSHLLPGEPGYMFVATIGFNPFIKFLSGIIMIPRQAIFSDPVHPFG